jgi:N-acetylmuramoyl-L-alanine amidase
MLVGPTGADAAPRPLVERGVVIVVDPGHGGANDGCSSADGASHEKELTLEVARQLDARLGGLLPHAEVVLTRQRDETMTLAERVSFANTKGADLFISIHANASLGRDQHGFETYLLDREASGREAARTARRENDEGLGRPGRDDQVTTMLRELELVTHRVRAGHLGRAIQAEQAERFPDRLDRGIKQAPFDVLMGARMPAVLFEIGFFDHPVEGTMLAEPEFQERVVDGLAAAIVRYYRDVHGRQ